jgi:hypothetical protein
MKSCVGRPQSAELSTGIYRTLVTLSESHGLIPRTASDSGDGGFGLW